MQSRTGIFRLVVVLGLLAGVTSCSSSEAPPDIDFAPLDSAIEGFLAEHDLEGATVVVVHRDYGIVHLRGYGAYDVNRISLLASSSKIISVGVLMRLADRGIVDLDAPVSQYMSAYGEHKTDITVAQMLSNSAGMVGLIDDPTYGPYLCQYIDIGSLKLCAKTIYGAPDEADRVPPDTEFHYGGGQWQLAGGVAEAASGKSWAELVRETYNEPCDLDTLGYTNQYSRSFTVEEGVEAALRYPSYFNGDIADLTPTENPSIEGGGYANAEDYGKILLMHLRGGRCGSHRVLSEAAVARMQVDHIATYGGVTPDPSLPGYGMGWWVSRDQPGLIADAGAYGASPWIDTERGYGIMVILEADATLGASVRQVAQPIVESIFDALPPR